MISEKSSEPFLSDIEVAKLLKMSRSWVRQQRYLRLHGKEHVLDIDPVYVGTSPRYRASEVINWTEAL